MNSGRRTAHHPPPTCPAQRFVRTLRSAPPPLRLQTEQRVRLSGLLPESQGHNLALTVLCVPHSLDRGTVPHATDGAIPRRPCPLQPRGGPVCPETREHSAERRPCHPPCEVAQLKPWGLSHFSALKGDFASLKGQIERLPGDGLSYLRGLVVPPTDFVRRKETSWWERWESSDVRRARRAAASRKSWAEQRGSLE